MQDLLRLSLSRRSAPNYWQNDEFLETCFFVNKLVVGSSLRYFNNNQRKLLVAKDNLKVFRICVGIWTCVSNMCLNNDSSMKLVSRHDITQQVKETIFFLIFAERNEIVTSLSKEWFKDTRNLVNFNVYIRSLSIFEQINES